MRPEFGQPEALDVEALDRRFRAYIAAREFPCVAAKSALARRTLRTLVVRDLAGSLDDALIYRTVSAFAADYRRRPGPFQSLAVICRNPARQEEADFERILWRRLQALSDIDVAACRLADARVSADPADANFSFSLAGEAFFIVSMHPGASRMSRRFETSVIIFNPHEQFERLRDQDRYEPLRAAIVERDIALQGYPNPELTRFGENSEARQYSGAHHGDNWACPFHRRAADPANDA